MKFFVSFFLYVLSTIVLLVIIFIRPFYLVRFNELISGRIGHFAANIELYCCEIDAGINVPNRPYIDIFYSGKDICNTQLATMWKREINISPYIFSLILFRLERLILTLKSTFPSLSLHCIGNNSQGDRDIHNLLDSSLPHLRFTQNEENIGRKFLIDAGLPINAKFICLIVRDKAYLNSRNYDVDENHYSFRDTNIDNYVMAVEELADKGYYVFRMGAAVKSKINTKHPKVIDYATNGTRRDFMDIYLGAKCEFCISVGTGFDAIPMIFRRPTVYVNMAPIGYLATWSSKNLLLIQHHFSKISNCELSLQEIIDEGAFFCYSSECYNAKGISLVENNPEEIRDQVIEMHERLIGVWIPGENDNFYQNTFWSIFPKNINGENGMPLHGKIKSIMGATFLRKNIFLLNV